MFLLKAVLLLFVYQNCCTAYPHHIGEELPKIKKFQATDDTTNGETQTQDGELSTTPGAILTTENGDCPANKSVFSKKDIRVMINYFSTGLSIYHSMVDHVVPQAKDINQKHLEDLKQFDLWFLNQPEHLIHVLEGLSAVRKQTIEPEAQKVAVILKDYPQAKKKLDEQQMNFNKLDQKLNKYEKLCKYTCEDHEPELSHVFKRSIPEEGERVCASIEELEKQIIEELTENFGIFINKTKHNLSIMNQTLTEKIEKFKIDLKEKALKEFGRTMYNVLYLEDQYQHFIKEMNATNTQIIMYAVKDLGLQIDSKLLELERLIEDYGNYCKNCNKGLVKRSVRHTESVISVNQKSSIVHKLIQNESAELENEVNKIIATIFKDINVILDDPARKDSYLNNLKLKQKQIKEVEDIERQALEHLKSVASPDSVKKLFDVASTSEVLLNNIDEKIAHLKKIIP